MCGIFGYIGKNSRSINKQAIHILGVANDARGGDSCGIFIDGKVDIGVGTTKLYSKFYKESTLLNDTTKAKVLLGHCRKASVGKINVGTAQPVVITNSKGEIDFVLIHNGTISNWQELATTYLQEVPEHYTDSYIMAYIFYNHGFDVLSEYKGAAAFVMVDYREDRENPITYMFKGASKATSHSIIPSEERPLFINTDGVNNSIWFSSLKDALEQAVNNKGETFSVMENILYTIHKGAILNASVYNREKMVQTEIAAVKPYQTKSYYSSYDEYNEYSDSYYRSSYNKTYHEDPTPSTIITASTISTVSEDIKNPIFKKVIDAHSEGNKTYLGARLCADGKYYYRGVPINGAFTIDFKVNTIGYLYFFEGYMIRSVEAYTIIKNAYEHITKICAPLTRSEFCEFYGGEMDLNIVTPYFDNVTKLFYVKGNLYTGTMIVPFDFNPYTLTIKKGIVLKETLLREDSIVKAYLRKRYMKSLKPLSIQEKLRMNKEFSIDEQYNYNL